MQRNQLLLLQRVLFRSCRAVCSLLFILSCMHIVGQHSVLQARGSQQSVPENDYKAAFIYHAARETVWPRYAFRSSTEAFRVGIIGNNDLAQTLKKLVLEKRIHARPVQVISLSGKERVPDSLHILFIGKKMYSKRHHFIDSLLTEPVLTISDMKEFTRCGGMIGLRLKKKNRVTLNLHSVAQAGLHFDDEFIRLAEITTGISPAYLYNIANLTTFPSHVMNNPDSVFTVGILGKSPFCKKAHNMLVQGKIHQMRIKLIVTSKVKKALRSNMVYISKSEQDTYRGYLQRLHSKQILTVSEIPQFAYNGGFVQFNIRDKRTPLTLNQTAALAGLEFHPKLLEIAHIVVATVTREND